MTGSLVVRADSTPPAGWDDLARDRGSFYHATAWIEGVGRTFRFPIRYLSASEGDALVGILPLAVVPTLSGAKRLVSFPFGFAAGPVGSPASVAVLLSRAVEEATALRCRRLEIKRADATDPPIGPFQRVVHYRSYRVATSGGIDPVWSKLHADSTRRGIRKAEREGVTVRRGDTEADWIRMAMLQERTSHQHGTPAPPRQFFTGLCSRLQSLGLADLWLAAAPGEGEVVAGVVAWKGPREWIYSFGASRPESLQLRPNHLLLWRLLQAAAEAGVDVNLGRAAPEQEGLVQFKLRWAGQPIDLQYDYWPSPGGLNVRDRDRGPLALAAAIWRRLPAPAARWGSRLYRYLG